MSTGLECEFIETEPGKWYYLLQNGDCPVMAPWREHCTAYGPFDDYDRAHKHLHRHHANPGGQMVTAYQEGYEPDEALKGLLESART